MKKLLILLPVLFLVTFVFPSNLSFFNHTQLIHKEINVSVFSESNYNSAAYNDAQAVVEVTVSKIDENKTVVLNKKTYKAMELKQFPSAANAINKKLMVTDNLSGNEALMVTYSITYNSNGSVIKFQNSKLVNKKTAKDNINIKI